MIRQSGPPSISRDRGRTHSPAVPSTIADDGEAVRMSQLAAELSHDLRVPLSTIVASMEMLEDQLHERRDPAVGTLLDRAAKAADRMLDQRLTVSSYVEGQLSVDVDLDKIANPLALDSPPLLELEEKETQHAVDRPHLEVPRTAVHGGTVQPRHRTCERGRGPRCTAGAAS
jgi:signal transduction histidine kinase